MEQLALWERWKLTVAGRLEKETRTWSMYFPSYRSLEFFSFWFWRPGHKPSPDPGTSFSLDEGILRGVTYFWSQDWEGAHLRHRESRGHPLDFVFCFACLLSQPLGNLQSQSLTPWWLGGSWTGRGRNAGGCQKALRSLRKGTLTLWPKQGSARQGSGNPCCFSSLSSCYLTSEAGLAVGTSAAAQGDQNCSFPAKGPRRGHSLSQSVREIEEKRQFEKGISKHLVWVSGLAHQLCVHGTDPGQHTQDCQNGTTEPWDWSLPTVTHTWNTSEQHCEFFEIELTWEPQALKG